MLHRICNHSIPPFLNTTIQGITPPPGNSSVLAASLIWPGNSSDYVERGDPPGAGTFRGFAEATDSSDLEMHEGDWIAQDTISGGMAGTGMSTKLNALINTDRSLRLVLWNASDNGYASSNFKVSGFGVFRLVAYGADWLLVELVHLDSSCGQT